MKPILLLLTFTIGVLATFNTQAQTTFYGVSPFVGDLFVIDTTTMTSTDTIPMTSTTGSVNGANGLATDPCGVLYIVYQAAGSRRLGTIDPTTGVITDIGNLSDNVANIAFVNGALVAVTGDGASTPETLYSVNLTTAVMTLINYLGNGDDGESIEFNPDDGLLYHWSGWGTSNVVMEHINPITFAITPISISGATLANVGASTYIGNGTFLISDVSNGGLKFITTGGVVTTTSNTTSTFKGLAAGIEPASVTNTTAPNDSICAGDTAVLICNNIGGTYEWFLDGTTTGITTNTFNANVSGAYVCAFSIGVCTFVSDTIQLAVLNSPTANITPSSSASICNGDTIELTVNAGGGPAQFQWYLDGSPIVGATTSNYFATVGGSYNILKTNQHGCSDSSAVATVLTLNSPPTAVITPSPNATVCAGDSLELTVNVSGGSGTIQWSLNGTDILGATIPSYFATVTGSYNVSVTDTNGCSDTAAVATAVSINALPPVALTPSGTVNFCNGDSVEISITQGAGGGNFQWYLDGIAILGATFPTIFASAEGAYNLQKTNINGCTDTSAVATVLVDTCANNLSEMKELELKIYPNPAADIVRIEFHSFSNSDITAIELVGLDGKVIRVFNVVETHSNGMSINVSDVNAGIYFIRLSTSFSSIVQELVIE